MPPKFFQIPNPIPAAPVVPIPLPQDIPAELEYNNYCPLRQYRNTHGDTEQNIDASVQFRGTYWRNLFSLTNQTNSPDNNFGYDDGQPKTDFRIIDRFPSHTDDAIPHLYKGSFKKFIVLANCFMVVMSFCAFVSLIVFLGGMATEKEKIDTKTPIPRVSILKSSVMYMIIGSFMACAPLIGFFWSHRTDSLTPTTQSFPFTFSMIFFFLMCLVVLVLVGSLGFDSFVFHPTFSFKMLTTTSQDNRDTMLNEGTIVSSLTVMFVFWVVGFVGLVFFCRWLCTRFVLNSSYDDTLLPTEYGVLTGQTNLNGRSFPYINGSTQANPLLYRGSLPVQCPLGMYTFVQKGIQNQRRYFVTFEFWKTFLLFELPYGVGLWLCFLYSTNLVSVVNMLYQGIQTPKQPTRALKQMYDATTGFLRFLSFVSLGCFLLWLYQFGYSVYTILRGNRPMTCMCMFLFVVVLISVVSNPDFLIVT